VADGQLQGWHSSLQSASAIQPVPHGSSTEAVEMPERQTTAPTLMQMSRQSLQPMAPATCAAE